MIKAPPGTPDESDGVIRDQERQIAELRANLDAATDLQNSATRAYAEQCEEIETLAAENARLRALPLKDEVERVLRKAHDETMSEAVSPSDPSMILAGIRQFGLAPDGSDLRDLEAAIDRLRAGEQEGWIAECATEGCNKPATVHFERGGVGSYYCHDCYIRIQALPTAPSEQGGERD